MYHLSLEPRTLSNLLSLHRIRSAGNHWYHSHDKTAETLFRQLYGPLIVVSQEEEDLQDQGILPDVEGTLVLSDTTFDADGDVAEVYQVPELAKMNGIEGSTLLVNGRINPKLNVEAGKPFMLRLINTSISRYWRLSLNDGSHMIRVGGEDGLIDKSVMEGGSHPAMEMDMPPISCSSDTDCVHSNYNTCVMDMGGHDGGGHHGREMMMDEHMDMMMGTCGEMSMNTMWDTGYEMGEIVLAPAMRATIVINPPQDKNQKIVLQWKDFNRGIHSMDMQMGAMCMTSDQCTHEDYPHCMLMMQGGMRMCGKMIHGHQHRPSIDILRIQTKKSKNEYLPFRAGEHLSAIQDLSSHMPNVMWTGSMGGHDGGHRATMMDGMMDDHGDGGMMDDHDDGGMVDGHGDGGMMDGHGDGGMMDDHGDGGMMGGGRINLQGGMNEDGTWFKIDDEQWSYGMGSTDSFPHPPMNQRHAMIGDLIEFEVHNHSDMNHPFHLHGFSFQPLAFMAMDHHMGTMKHFTYRTLEFMDTMDIPPHTSMIARVVMNDIVGHNAAAGRWLFHCHIAQHAELGMISEILVAPAGGHH